MRGITPVFFCVFSNFLGGGGGGGGEGYDPTSVPHKSVEWYLNLKGSLTYHAVLLGWALRLGLRPYYWCFH